MPNAGCCFSKSHIAWLLAVVALLWFVILDLRKLAEADEC